MLFTFLSTFYFFYNPDLTMEGVVNTKASIYGCETPKVHAPADLNYVLQKCSHNWNPFWLCHSLNTFEVCSTVLGIKPQKQILFTLNLCKKCYK